MQRNRHGRHVYSEFFTSGLRAMMERRSRTSYNRDSTASTLCLDGSSPSSSARRRSFGRIASWRSSIILPSTRSIASSVSEPSGSRRSSILSLSRLFDRRKVSDSSLSFSASPQTNARELFGTPEITEVWITKGGPYTPSLTSGSLESDGLHQNIDPFGSSRDSKSFFADLSDGPRSSSIRESFLSFSSDNSFFPIPSLSRRDRPKSVQSISTPARSQSRRSSESFRPLSWIKADISFISGEGEPTDLPLIEDAAWTDPAQNIDWRQFHIELLLEEAA